MASSLDLALNWQCQPQAEAFILAVIEEALAQSPFLLHLQEELKKGCSTELLAWIDHVAIKKSAHKQKQLKGTGFECIGEEKMGQHFRHPGAKLPTVVLKPHDGNIDIALSVESIAQFLSVRGLKRPIEGSPFSGFRRSLIACENGVNIWAIERRGVETLEPIQENKAAIAEYFACQELWMTRPRSLEDEEGILREAEKLAQELAKQLTKDRAAALILECERAYWQARNTAGQFQKNRQDRLGMGWANHDHHTFRSSRKHFHRLVKLFERLGFFCRERFYAGEQAGWGAQVMENPRAKLVLFLDVDLSPGEIDIDFAHEELPEKEKLGTIGLWCALHGDSILKAGMHHLEAQFDFEALAHDLKAHGIGMMDPFSNFPYLKQAFTHGEIWPVAQGRIDVLLEQNRITPEEADKFMRLGAIGSHLENLQRKEGYKGFNRNNVSFIIQKTDPRRF
jgi:hypothetical protein